MIFIIISNTFSLMLTFFNDIDFVLEIVNLLQTSFIIKYIAIFLTIFLKKLCHSKISHEKYKGTSETERKR